MTGGGRVGRSGRGTRLGGEARTLSGLAGVGDLLATCVSPQSRNATVGRQLGAGRADVMRLVLGKALVLAAAGIAAGGAGAPWRRAPPAAPAVATGAAQRGSAAGEARTAPAIVLSSSSNPNRRRRRRR